MSRLGTGKINEDQIRAAYMLYEYGLSTRDLAEIMWKTFGYKNVDACRMSLRYAFKARGFTLRSKSDGMKIHHKKRKNLTNE